MKARMVLTAAAALLALLSQAQGTRVCRIRNSDGTWRTEAHYGVWFNSEADGACYEDVGGEGVLMVSDGDEIARIDTIPPTYGWFRVACEAFGAEDPEWLYAMARLETGNFRAPLFTERKNPMALRPGGKYATFPYWADCIRAYVKMVQRKRKQGEAMEAFLLRIGYSEDPGYISKVKGMMPKGAAAAE